MCYSDDIWENVWNFVWENQLLFLYSSINLSQRMWKRVNFTFKTFHKAYSKHRKATFATDSQSWKQFKLLSPHSPPFIFSPLHTFVPELCLPVVMSAAELSHILRVNRTRTPAAQRNHALCHGLEPNCCSSFLAFGCHPSVLPCLSSDSSVSWLQRNKRGCFLCSAAQEGKQRERFVRVGWAREGGWEGGVSSKVNGVRAEWTATTTSWYAEGY